MTDLHKHDPIRDPLGLSVLLGEALANRSLKQIAGGAASTPADQAAALELAMVLGKCHKVGVELGSADGVLPVPVAIAAAHGMVTRLGLLLAEAQSLGARWETALDQIEMNDILIYALRDRIDMYAAYSELIEADLSALEGREPGRAELDAAIGQVTPLLGEYDDALWAERELLSLVADLPLLKTYSNLMTKAGAEILPWWANGSLVEIAQANMPQVVPSAPQKPPTITFPQATVSAWLPEIARPLAAASKNEDELEEKKRPYWWLQPGGLAYAKMRVPRMVRTENHRLTVEIFKQGLDEPATEFSGEKIWLAGVPGQIDQTGAAEFRVGDLNASGQGPVLQVGDDFRDWIETEFPR